MGNEKVSAVIRYMKEGLYLETMETHKMEKEGYKLEAVTDYGVFPNGDLDLDRPELYEEIVEGDKQAAVKRAIQVVKTIEDRNIHGQVYLIPFHKPASADYEYDYDNCLIVEADGVVWGDML